MRDSYLEFDYAKNQWVVGVYSNPHIFAINNATDSKSVLPFGTQDWYIFNDTCNNGNSLMKKNKLSLSRCAEDEFTCQDDGTW